MRKLITYRMIYLVCSFSYNKRVREARNSEEEETAKD